MLDVHEVQATDVVDVVRLASQSQLLRELVDLVVIRQLDFNNGGAVRISSNVVLGLSVRRDRSDCADVRVDIDRPRVGPGFNVEGTREIQGHLIVRTKRFRAHVRKWIACQIECDTFQLVATVLGA